MNYVDTNSIYQLQTFDNNDMFGTTRILCTFYLYDHSLALQVPPYYIPDTGRINWKISISDFELFVNLKVTLLSLKIDENNLGKNLFVF